MKLLRIQFLLILIFSLTLTFLKAEETKIENRISSDSIRVNTFIHTYKTLVNSCEFTKMKNGVNFFFMRA